MDLSKLTSQKAVEDLNDTSFLEVVNQLGLIPFQDRKVLNKAIWDKISATVKKPAASIPGLSGLKGLVDKFDTFLNENEAVKTLLLAWLADRRYMDEKETAAAIKKAITAYHTQVLVIVAAGDEALRNEMVEALTNLRLDSNEDAPVPEVPIEILEEEPPKPAEVKQTVWVRLNKALDKPL